MIEIDFAERLPPWLLQDYLARRADWYAHRNGLPASFGARDAFDDGSHIVLATDGRRCLGGARATVAAPGEPLPMERLCPGLRLQDLFPEHGLPDEPRAEFSKLVVFENGDLRNDLALRMFGFMLEHNPRPDVRFAFSICAEKRHAMYRFLARAHRLPCQARRLPDALVPPDLRPFGSQMIQAYSLERSPAR